MIKCFEGFAGFGGLSFALKKLGIEHKVVGFSEIDKYAVKMYHQNHGNIKNYGDITKINPEKLPDFDLLSGGFPCQAFSIAGQRKGFDDMRGTLVYDLLRIAKAKKPKYLLFENVRGLNSHDNGKTVSIIVEEIEALGYSIAGKQWDKDNKCWQLPVLNSRDFGIPQNRERVWIVAKLGKWDFMEFMFPEKEELKIFVKDILEPNVDKKYILSDRMVKTILSRNRKQGFEVSPTITCNIAKGNESTPIFPLSADIPKPYRVYDTNGVFSTINTRDLPSICNQRVNPEVAHTLTAGANSTGLHSDMDIFTINPRKPDGSQTYQQDRIYDSKGIVPSICNTRADLLIKDMQFRRLTPRECFRLMGFLEDEIILDGLSNAQLYKLAGNGWEITVVTKILKNLLKNGTK